MATQTKFRSVLFVDVSDSTRLYDSLGDEDGRSVLLECLDVLDETVKSSGGTVVDRIGDELMCTFPFAAAAMSAAARLQSAVEEAKSAGRLPTEIHVRIGFHQGALVLDGQRIFGDTVHLARRVASLAKAQQILTTQQTLARVPLVDQLPTRFVDRTHVKGKREPIELHEVIWDEKLATVQGDTPGLAATTRSDPRLVVTYEGSEFRLGTARPTLTFGRGANCDLVIEHPQVSRLHARIECRKSVFFFVDQSTNGSVVFDGRKAPIFLRREEYVLNGEGRVVLGQDTPHGEAPSLSYRHPTDKPDNSGG